MSVIDRLKKHILVDGFHLVVDTDASQDSWIVDKETGKRYLDCYSQFASQPFGWNYSSMQSYAPILNGIAMNKLANSDMYSETYADFVEEFANNAKDFKHFFFIDGGTLGVENALKAAFDWKCQVSPSHQSNDGQYLDVIHLKEAFHGRSGYTMSLTNTGELKTKWYPKFHWTRIINPKITFPIDDDNTDNVAYLETEAIRRAEKALRTGNVAAIIVEPIQGEGGDNHFRREFFSLLRALADQYKAMLIFDEVQTGVGLTGKMWCYQHFGVTPDIMCFGKKTQVCGFCATEKIEQASEHVFKKSGRINSTWGGNIVDMARARIYLRIIQQNKLVEHAAQVGAYFLKELQQLDGNGIENVRGRGLMIAFDLPTVERRDEVVVKLSEHMLVLKCGTKSIRLRPHLTFSNSSADQAVQFIKMALS